MGQGEGLEAKAAKRAKTAKMAKLRLCDGVLREQVATATQEIFMEGGECSEVVRLGSLGGDRQDMKETR